MTSSVDQEQVSLSYAVQAQATFPFTEEYQDPVPGALKEAVELIKSANRRFEDCAVEWQSKISHEQWKLMANADRAQDQCWEHSVLARTYFADKTLDDAFKSLLTYDKTITYYLHNFISLLRGEESPIFPTRASLTQSRSSDQKGNPTVDNAIASFDLTVSQEDHRHQAEIKSPANDTVSSNVQQSFSDLIKAKINFDIKFLGFEATLNGTTYADATANNNAIGCLCQICSNVLASTASTCASKKSSGVKNTGKRRSRRSTILRTSVKRLAQRPARTSTIRTRGRNQSISLTEIPNDPLVKHNERQTSKIVE